MKFSITLRNWSQNMIIYNLINLTGEINSPINLRTYDPLSKSPKSTTVFSAKSLPDFNILPIISATTKTLFTKSGFTEISIWEDDGFGHTEISNSN